MSRIDEVGQCKKEGCTKHRMWRFFETAEGGFKKRLTDFCRFCEKQTDMKPHSLRDGIQAVWSEIINEVKNEIEKEIENDPYEIKRK